jgi:hypothetical protein
MRNARPRSRPLSRPCTLAGICVSVLLAGAGCEPRSTRFEIVDYGASGEQGRFFEEFDECYYARRTDGVVDVVALRRGRLAGEAEEDTTQVIHLHTIWRPQPGTTAVDSTQVNATISYWIMGASGGIALEGGGFLFSRENYEGDVLTGSLESSALHPVRRVGRGPSLFERAELTGTFRALRDRAKTFRLINEMKNRFGPLPRYKPPPPGPF